VANYVFGTTGLGRVGEYVNRVLGNDPANSALIAIPMSQSGTAEQAEALTTFAAVEADANFAEQAAGSWGRKTLDETGDGLAWAWDATNNRNEADANDLVWTAPATGANTTGLVICYDPDSTGGADSALIPLIHLDMAVTANDQQVTFQFNAEGFFNATRS
jgi:hypothetical protein